jgi:hypothetical protein
MVESSNSVFAFPNLAHLTHHKLEGPNYTVWVSQFEPIFRTYDFESFVDGSEPVLPNLLLIRTDKSQPLST